LLKIIILLLLSINIFANDIFELYRTQGINAVEKKLKDSLKDISTWEEYLENKNVDLTCHGAAVRRRTINKRG